MQPYCEQQLGSACSRSRTVCCLKETACKHNSVAVVGRHIRFLTFKPANDFSPPYGLCAELGEHVTELLPLGWMYGRERSCKQTLDLNDT